MMTCRGPIPPSHRSGSPLLAVLLVALCASVATSRTWTVLPDGTGDAPTIQAAVDSAQAGDVIALAAGTFTGEGNCEVDLQGKAITLRSQASDPATCLIDCEGSEVNPRRGLLIRSGETAATVVEYLTVANGYHPDGGGGLLIENASPTIRGCVLQDNAGCWDDGGSGAKIVGGSPRFEDCVFLRDIATATVVYSAAGYGGGMLCRDADVEITSCQFIENEAQTTCDVGGGGGAIAAFESDLTISDCEFVGNRSHFCAMGASFGAAVYGADATVQVERSVFAANSGEFGIGDVVLAQGSSVMSFSRCTFVANVGPGQGISVGATATLHLEDTIIAFGATYGSPTNPPVGGDGAITLTSCNVFGNEGGDWIEDIAGQQFQGSNFSADPCFCDADGGDYHLCADSVCAPAHNPYGLDRLIGALDVGCGSCGCPAAVAVDEGPAVPRPLALQVAPNPFNPRTVIAFVLPETGQVVLTVHDTAGRRVATLLDESLGGGRHTVVWDGRNARGRAVASGSYLVRMKTADGMATQKLALLR